MKKPFIFAVIFSFMGMVMAMAADHPATTMPTTQPVGTVPVQAGSEMDRMLQTSQAALPIQPEANPPPVDATSGMAAVKPNAPPVLLRPEGFYVIGRLARLGKTKGGFRELIFDSDGQAMRDPPMRILPNELLGSMEGQTLGSSDPLAFRVSGYITQYKDRNYILIDKAVPEPRK